MIQTRLPILLVLLPVLFLAEASVYNRRWGYGGRGGPFRGAGYFGGYGGGGYGSWNQFGGSFGGGFRGNNGGFGGSFGGGNFNNPSQPFNNPSQPSNNNNNNGGSSIRNGAASTLVHSSVQGGSSTGDGSCPLTRPSCTASRTRPLSCSSGDVQCGPGRKCCFDICLQTNVCKKTV